MTVVLACCCLWGGFPHLFFIMFLFILFFPGARRRQSGQAGRAEHLSAKFTACHQQPRLFSQRQWRRSPNKPNPKTKTGTRERSSVLTVNEKETLQQDGRSGVEEWCGGVEEWCEGGSGGGGVEVEVESFQKMEKDPRKKPSF